MKIWMRRDLWVLLIFLGFFAGMYGVYEYDTHTKRAELNIIEKINGPTVKVVVYVPVSNTAEDGTETITERLAGHGSGVIVARKGATYFVLTAHHMLDVEQYKMGAWRFYIEHENLVEKVPAFVLYGREPHDLLMLIMTVPDIDLPVAEFAPEEPNELTDIRLRGHGSYFTAYTTKGTITSKRAVWPLALHIWMTDASVWKGMSGGGAWSEEGQLIGIISCLRVIQEGYYRQYMTDQSGIISYPAVKSFLEEIGFAQSRNEAARPRYVHRWFKEEDVLEHIPDFHGR